jgi:hypothetical protein
MDRCPVNINILTPKVGHQLSFQKQNDVFRDNECNDFDLMSTIYGDNSPKQDCMGDIFRKITVRAVCA